jgi:hydrogenase-4 component B
MSPLDSPLAACLALLAGWAVVGAAGLLRPASVMFVGRVLFPLGAVIGAVLAVVAGMGFDAPVERITLMIGLEREPRPA